MADATATTGTADTADIPHAAAPHGHRCFLRPPARQGKSVRPAPDSVGRLPRSEKLQWPVVDMHVEVEAG